jgi:SMODS and SLOG-associating 2TM effector domain 2
MDSGAVSNTVSGDLMSVRLPQIDQDEDAWVVADRLFRWVEASALTTLEWYLKEKRPKARRSRLLRLLAIGLAALGSVAPFVAVGTSNAKFAFWGYPLLGAAAACVGADRALGLSTSWMRYQTTATTIEGLLIRHQLRWAVAAKEFDSSEVPETSFRGLMDEIRVFAVELSEIVAAETRGWSDEFRSHFSHLEAEAGRFAS